MFRYDRMNALVQKTGVSKSHICRELGKSRYYLRDAEKHQIDIQGESLQIIADILGTTPEYLSGKADEQNPPTSRSGNPWAERLRSLSPADLSLFVRILESLESNPTGTRAALDLALTAAQSVRQAP